MVQDLSESLAEVSENEVENSPKNFEIHIDVRRLDIKSIGEPSKHLEYVIRNTNIGATFIEPMNRFLSDESVRESRIDAIGSVEFIESADEYFLYDVLAYGFRHNLSVVVYDARRIVDMIADNDYSIRKSITKNLRLYDLICVANLHLVSVNEYLQALSSVISASVTPNTKLVFQAKSFDKAYEKCKDYPIGNRIKSLKPIVLKQIESQSVLTFDSLVAKQNLSLPSNQYCLPMIFSRIGLFSAIDSVERRKLTEIREPDRWNPTRREIDIPIVRDFTFNGMYVQISGPVVDVDTDMKTFTFLLSEFLRNPNGQGLIKTSWKKIARGFDYEKDPSKMGGKDVVNKQRSVQRLADVSIKIFDAKSNVLLYKGGFIDRIAQEGKGRASYLSLKLSQDIAKELLKYNAIDIGLLELPQVEFVVYNYIRSHRKIYDMKLDSWVLVLGRNYRGYSLNMTMLRRSLTKAFKNLEERKLIAGGWSVTDDFVRNVKLLEV